MSTHRAVPRFRWLSSLPALLVVSAAGLLYGAPGAGTSPTPAPAPVESAGAVAAAQGHATGRFVRPLEVSPRIGPPGTQVMLKAGPLPALTPVQLAIGATRSGFEALALRLTTIDGDLEEAVEVPVWGQRDQTHRFLIFNIYFTTVLAESQIFHVTDADGVVVREGAIGSAASSCPILEGDDGERYRLTGAVGNVAAGERARLEGVLSEAPEGCGEELTLELDVRVRH